MMVIWLCVIGCVVVYFSEVCMYEKIMVVVDGSVLLK